MPKLDTINQIIDKVEGAREELRSLRNPLPPISQDEQIMPCTCGIEDPDDNHDKWVHPDEADVQLLWSDINTRHTLIHRAVRGGGDLNQVLVERALTEQIDNLLRLRRYSRHGVLVPPRAE